MRSLYAAPSYLALFISIACFWSTGLGAEEPGLQEQIQSIRSASQKEADRLIDLQVRQTKTNRKLTTAKSQLLKIEQEETSLLSEIEDQEHALRQLKVEINRLESEKQKINDAINKRVRALYIMESRDISAFLLGMRRGRDFERVSYFISRIQRSDRELFDSLVALTEQQDRERLKQAKLIEKQESTLESLKQQKVEFEQKQREILSLLGEIEAQSELIQEKLFSLEAQALRLESVLASLTSEPTLELSSSRSPPAKSTRLVEKAGQKKAPYQGIGLFRLKGSLEYPVDGKVLAPFGRSTQKQFGQLVTNKGITFRAKQDTPVVAIGPGRVIFSGSMPGLDDVVILDHGERYYSLYGRLGAIEAELSVDFEGGDRLGVVGSTEELYFEIRKNGSTVNPESYYSRPFASID